MSFADLDSTVQKQLVIDMRATSRIPARHRPEVQVENAGHALHLAHSRADYPEIEAARDILQQDVSRVAQ